MADLEKKLADFSKILLSEAEEEKNKIIAKLNDTKKSATEKKEYELLSDAYDDIQKAVSKYSKEYNELVLKKEMELKKSAIKKREEIIDGVFSSVKDKLTAFINSDKYEAWLISLAKKACAEVGTGDIFISSDDMKYAPKIESEISGSSVKEAEDKEIIGGVIASCDRLSADYTIKQMLSEEYAKFLKNSELSIKL